jgi:hypothetical protein
MTYTGQVKNGVVVLEGDVKLEEGRRVRVLVDEPADRPPRGSPEAILRHAGIWAGDDDEIDRLLAELKQMKQDELRRQLEEPEPEL